MKYFKSEDVKKVLDSRIISRHELNEAITRDMNNLDGIDIVLCKDCINHGRSHHTGECYCKVHGTDMPKNGFCSLGSIKGAAEVKKRSLFRRNKG